MRDVHSGMQLARKLRPGSGKSTPYLGVVRRRERMKRLGATGIAALALLLAGCDDRQQRIEEAAAPGMEADAAAPGSGPIDIDVDTIQPDQFQPLPDTVDLVPQRMPPVTPGGQQPPPDPQGPGGR
jgi:hypothetical protein